MVCYAPFNAGRIGGRCRSTTAEEIRFLNNFTNNFFIRGTNVLAAIQPAIRSNSNRNHNRNDRHNQRGQCWGSATQGSRWAESEAFHCFKAQSCQLDCRLSEFMSCTYPSSREIIAMTNRASQRIMQCRQNHGLIITALELAQAESMAARQVNALVYALWKEEKYGHTPREKPAHSIRLVMENFSSLRVTSGYSKITTINNLLSNFKVDMLCGCKTQVDWRMVPQDWCFHNRFGIKSETQSVVAHNTNEQMRPNQYSGCMMMALGTLSPEVVDSDVDSTGLGRWCWIHLGLGTKK